MEKSRHGMVATRPAQRKAARHRVSSRSMPHTHVAALFGIYGNKSWVCLMLCAFQRAVYVAPGRATIARTQESRTLVYLLCQLLSAADRNNLWYTFSFQGESQPGAEGGPAVHDRSRRPRNSGQVRNEYRQIALFIALCLRTYRFSRDLWGP